MRNSNTLTSHHPESNNSRADKMSGSKSGYRKMMNGKSKKASKKFANKKRRIFLKNIYNEKI